MTDLSRARDVAWTDRPASYRNFADVAQWDEPKAGDSKDWLRVMTDATVLL